ncbi:hypothetical protein [Bradyrhizobium sp. NAS80.1]|uniref:amino acid kinase family protein n=1 Tax=Bradyrhizobium sp. NAS80.1 TaxID=1680159 RepID=UPI001AEFF880|nr:hypothetical protein [Bradyrhizobium sp. NAS80.1]
MAIRHSRFGSSLLGSDAFRHIGPMPALFLLAECYGCATHTLIKDVNGLYEVDPKLNPDAKFIGEITVSDLRRRNLPTLPFDRVLLDLLANARQVKSFQIINGLRPELLERALRGEHVGTIVRKD